jgi:hypothetical protein
MPITLAALDVHFLVFTLRRTAIFQACKLAYRAEFQGRQTTWASVEALVSGDADFHVTAEMQEELIILLPDVACELAQHANYLQRSGAGD